MDSYTNVLDHLKSKHRNVLDLPACSNSKSGSGSKWGGKGFIKERPKSPTKPCPIPAKDKGFLGRLLPPTPRATPRPTNSRNRGDHQKDDASLEAQPGRSRSKTLKANKKIIPQDAKQSSVTDSYAIIGDGTKTQSKFPRNTYSPKDGKSRPTLAKSKCYVKVELPDSDGEKSNFRRCLRKTKRSLKCSDADGDCFKSSDYSSKSSHLNNPDIITASTTIIKSGPIFNNEEIKQLKNVMKKRFDEASNLQEIMPSKEPQILESEKKKECTSEYSTSVTTEEEKTIENNVQENTETITECISNKNLASVDRDQVKSLEKKKTVTTKVDSSTIKGANFVQTIVKKTNIEIMNETRIGGVEKEAIAGPSSSRVKTDKL